MPLIAAVNGAAVGWGMELAPLADLRVASERAHREGVRAFLEKRAPRYVGR